MDEASGRARLVVAASAGVVFLSLFAAFFQALSGSPTIALFAVCVSLVIGAVPTVLRRTASIPLAVNMLTGSFFSALSAVAILSGAEGTAAILMLVLVPVLALLAPGRIIPCTWAVLVLLELVLLQNIERLGLPVLVPPHPQAAGNAIFRIPFILTLFILGAGLAAEKILRETSEARSEAELRLAASDSKRTRLEARMAERKENLAAVGTLAAGIAHQINNPVGSILAAAQLRLTTLTDEASDRPADRELLESIEQQALRCGRIVRALLRFSRGETPEKWEEDFNLVVRTAVNAAHPYALSMQAKLEFEPAPDEVRITVSPIELEQAIVNLIHNALEARENGAEVHVETAFTDTHATVRVVDNGPGIDEEARALIFSPFYTTREGAGGSGLGLSVVRDIAESHGGAARVEPAAGGLGSAFSIEIPRDSGGTHLQTAAPDATASEGNRG